MGGALPRDPSGPWIRRRPRSMPNGRGRPPPPPLTLAQPPVANGGPPPAGVSVPRRESSRGRGEVLKEAGGLRPPASLRSSPSPPLTAVSAAWSSSPGGEPLACARDPGRGEGGEAEGLAECEGLPHRTSGTWTLASTARAVAGWVDDLQAVDQNRRIWSPDGIP